MRLLARKVYAEIPPRVQYGLTAVGEDFWHSAKPPVDWPSGAIMHDVTD